MKESDSPETEIIILPHTSSEFRLWLWWASEIGGGQIMLHDGDPIDVWIEDRIALRKPEDTSASTVLTGDNPSVSPEAKASLRGGKVVDQLKIGLRVEDRDYVFGLIGPDLGLGGLKMPTLVDSDNGVADERLLLLAEIEHALRRLFTTFAVLRTSSKWSSVEDDIRAWKEAA